MTTFEIKDNQVFRNSASSGLKFSAFDFWTFAKSHPIADLRIRSIAKVKMSIELVAEVPNLVFKAQTEIGKIDLPKNFDISWDHVVIGKDWFPLDESESLHLAETFGSELQLKHHPLDRKAFFKLLKKSNENFYSLELDEKISDPLIWTEKSTHEIKVLGDPYRYQEIGIGWLTSYFDNGLGALLGDEMGLGKTFQSIALIAHAYQAPNSKVLVVVPAMLIANWQREFQKFAPSMEYFLHYGGTRSFSQNAFDEQKLVLTSYELLVRDIAIFSRYKWDLVLSDEAQALKNPDSQRRKAVAQVECDSKVLVTGTPVENSLRDLWSLIDLIHPGFLGERAEFESNISGDLQSAFRYGQTARPYILRRSVEDVDLELPDLIEIDEPLICSASFSNAYEQVRSGAIDDNNGKDSFLAVINQLTQICCNPSLIFENYFDDEDAKLKRLESLLDEIVLAKREKVLIFTTFSQSINLLRNFIGLRYGYESLEIIDGRVNPQLRQEIIDRFNDGKNALKILILNPTAGGVGLNIVGANHVVHYNRQWNPQKELQATKRAHRNGQTKTVFVHKFYYLETIEEVINERQIYKMDLADASLENSLRQEDEILKSKAMLITPKRSQ